MPTYQYERLPVVIAADPGATISLQAVFDRAFDVGWTFPGGFSVYANSTAASSYTDPASGTFISFGHWDPANEKDGYFRIAGENLELGQSKYFPSFANFGSVELIAGNSLTPLVHVAVQNSYIQGQDPIYTWYTIPIVPSAMATGSECAPTGADIRAKALQYVEAYRQVPLPYDCGWIVESIVAAAGAPLPVKCYSLDPSENREGGLWRIVHRGDENPVQNWQSLVKAGDVVRLDWKDGLFHTTLVIEPEGPDGRMRVVDNNGPNGETAARYVDFEQAAIPQSVTIYRLSADSLYLLEGTGGSENLNGNPHADDLRGAGGNDIMSAGNGNDKVTGGSGDDTIDGGDGVDRAIFSSTYSTYALTDLGSGSVRVVGPDGTDTLSRVELLQFADRTLNSNDLTSRAERFFDSATGDHFYTLSPAEADRIRATLPTFHDEGSPWSTPDKGFNTIDVFRFFDTATGTHFLTSSTVERDFIIAHTPTLHLERASPLKPTLPQKRVL